MNNIMQLHTAARVHINSKTDIIIMVAAIILYFVINVIIQTVKPNMKQKTINIISVIAALLILVIGIIVI